MLSIFKLRKDKEQDKQEYKLNKKLFSILENIDNENDLTEEEKHILSITDKRYTYVNRQRGSGLTTSAILKALKTLLEGKDVCIICKFHTQVLYTKRKAIDIINPNKLNKNFILKDNSILNKKKGTLDFLSLSQTKGMGRYDLIIIDDYMFNDKSFEYTIKNLIPCSIKEDGQVLLLARKINRLH